MKHQITNGRLTVEAETLGAQLASIRKDGAEYLWQGDEKTWPDRALVIFPYVARLTGGKYQYKGQTYSMPNHGFAPSSEFRCETPRPEEMRFILCDTPETRGMYPFSFCFTVCYRLEGDTLWQEYTVENRGEEPMYFGLGGHPGFNVPMEPGCSFEDYALQFEPDLSPVRVGFTEKCFLSGDDRPFPLENDRLPLKHTLFDDDAIVLKNAGEKVVLSSPKGTRSITAEYKGFPYLGIWHWPKTAVPYVCIEPWSSLPSRQDVVEDLERQPNLIRLPAGETCRAAMAFTFR